MHELKYMKWEQKHVHTFIWNIIGDIIPKIQTTAEHAHFFHAFFHVTQNTRFSETHTRNHLRSSWCLH